MSLSKTDVEALRDAIQDLLFFAVHPPTGDGTADLSEAWKTVERLAAAPIRVPGENGEVWSFKLREAAWQAYCQATRTKGAACSTDTLRHLRACQDTLRVLVVEEAKTPCERTPSGDSGTTNISQPQAVVGPLERVRKREQARLRQERRTSRERQRRDAFGTLWMNVCRHRLDYLIELDAPDIVLADLPESQPYRANHYAHFLNLWVGWFMRLGRAIRDMGLDATLCSLMNPQDGRFGYGTPDSTDTDSCSLALSALQLAVDGNETELRQLLDGVCQLVPPEYCWGPSFLYFHLWLDAFRVRMLEDLDGVSAQSQTMSVPTLSEPTQHPAVVEEANQPTRQTAPNKKKGGRRVDPKRRAEDEKFLRDWMAAKEQGVTKKEFARRRGISRDEVNIRIDRQQARNRRAMNVGPPTNSQQV